jgi:hypothetical protein
MPILSSLVVAAMMSAVTLGELPRAVAVETGKPSIDRAVRTDPPPLSVAQDARADSVHVGNIRFEAPPATVPHPSVLLKFEVVNNGGEPLTDPLIRILVTEKVAPDVGIAPRVLVQPFVVTGTPMIAPGYSVDYQMLMQNLTVDCGCVAHVTVMPQPRAAAAASTPIP